MYNVYSIGHSTLYKKLFFEHLHKYSVQVLIDVRTKPYSTYCPEYNREALRDECIRQKIYYRWWGDRMGGKPTDRKFLTKNGAFDYGQMAKEPAFQEALATIAASAQNGVICIMCSEGKPEICHRAREIGRELFVQYGINMQHILTNGTLTDEQQLLSQILHYSVNRDNVGTLCSVRPDYRQNAYSQSNPNKQSQMSDKKIGYTNPQTPLEETAFVKIGKRTFSEVAPCNLEITCTYNGQIKNCHWNNGVNSKWTARPLAEIASCYNHINEKTRDLYDVDVITKKGDNAQFLLVSATLKYGKLVYRFLNKETSNKAKSLSGTYSYDDEYTLHYVYDHYDSFEKLIRNKNVDINSYVDSFVSKGAKEWRCKVNRSIDTKGLPVVSIQALNKKAFCMADYVVRFDNTRKMYVIYSKIHNQEIKSVTIRADKNPYHVFSPDGKTVNGFDVNREYVNIKKLMSEKGFQMSAEKGKKLRVFVDSAGHLGIRGTFTGKRNVDYGEDIENKQGFTVITLTTGDVEKVKNTLDTAYMPTNNRGEQVRTIAQDSENNYQREWTTKKGKREQDFIRKEEQVTNRMLSNIERTLLYQLELENLRNENKKLGAGKKLPKGQNKKLLWLNKIDKTKPKFINATNWKYLLSYTLEQLEKDVFTQQQATDFCEKNAKY